MDSYSDNFLKIFPDLIKAAATSDLGILALVILVLSTLAYFFFKDSSERVRVIIFMLLFAGAGAFSYALLQAYRGHVPTSAERARGSTSQSATEQVDPSKTTGDPEWWTLFQKEGKSD